LTYPTVSVVIAAYNEEAVIARCLRTLTAGARPGELDVVVVANACEDATAAVARAEGARVVETRTPGKAHALALGDAECQTFPRAYLDADVDLSTDALRLLVAALAGENVLACSPIPDFDLTGVAAPAARFHRVTERLMADRRGLAGAGVYVLSEAGHKKVFPMPPVISDDGYVHRSFADDERVVVTEARSVVRPARSLGAVIKRRARVRLGNEELNRIGLIQHGTSLRPGHLAGLVRRGDAGKGDAALFLSVLAAERMLARWRNRRKSVAIWSPDATSRS
jgi:glycosyltransferase involved in cell wall biosynthesis